MPMAAWLLTGLALIIVSSNHNAAFFLGAALVALIFAIPLWVAFLCLKIRITQWPAEAYGGCKLPLALELHNPWPVPIINLKVELVLQNELNLHYETMHLVVDLNPLADCRQTWEAGPLPRGVYNLVGMRLLGRAPFGLISWSRQLGLDGSIKVFPLLLPVSYGYPVSGYAGMRQMSINRKNQGILPDGIRNYNPGDSMSRIHWKASASHGELLSKAFIEEKGGTKVLVAGYWSEDGAENEALVTAAASLAWAWFQQGTEFHFILYALEKHDLGLILTPENMEQVLQVLTRAMPCSAEQAEEGMVDYILQSLQTGTGEVIILTSEEQTSEEQTGKEITGPKTNGKKFVVPEACQQMGCSAVVVTVAAGTSAEGIVEVLEGVG